MCQVTDRFDQLSPRDTAITLRSLGRRIGDTAAKALQQPEAATLVDATGPGGFSLSSAIDASARAQAFLLNELGKALDHENPVVSAAVEDTQLRDFVEDRPVPPTVGLESLSVDTSLAADRLESASTESMSRQVPVVGGGTTSALAIAQEAARSGVRTLTDITSIADWIRTKHVS